MCFLIGSKFFCAGGGSGSYNCKDVDVVSVLPECTTSSMPNLLGSEMTGDHILKDTTLLKDTAFINSRIRNQEDPSLDYDSGHDGMSVSSSIFEFQKAERAAQRVPLAPFSKPVRSKWDDAQKWIQSPTSNRPKTGQTHVQSGQGVGSRKGANPGYGNRQPSTKVVVEVPDQKVVAFEEPDTKRMDTNQAKMESWGQKVANWEDNSYPTADSYGKPVLMIESSVEESAGKNQVVFVFSSFLFFVFFCFFPRNKSLEFYYCNQTRLLFVSSMF